jgi:inner membrane protein
VIAVEANTALIPYLNRTHELNGVSNVETINAVLAEGKTGRIPFFARRDLRTSSLLPHDRAWQQVMMVPFMNLNLILTEERISLIICDIPAASAQLLAHAELDQVDDILMNCEEDSDAFWGLGGIGSLMSARGFSAERSADAVLFSRDSEERLVGPADSDFGEYEQDELELIEPVLVGDIDTIGTEQAEMMDDLIDAEQAEMTDDLIDAEQAGMIDDPIDAEQAGMMDDAAEDFPEDVAASARSPQSDEPMHDGEPVVVPAAEIEGMAVEGMAAGGAGSELAMAPLDEPPRDTYRQAQDQTRDQDPRDHNVGRGQYSDASQPDIEGGVPGGGMARRLWGLIALSMLLALPLMLISKIAADRSADRAGVVEAVGAAWGGAQTVTGPFLVIPVETLADGMRRQPLVVVPEMLEIDSALSTEIRQSDAYQVPVYRGRHEFWLSIDPASVSSESAARLLSAGEVALWNDAVLSVGVSEPRSLRQATMLDGMVIDRGGPDDGGRVGFRARNFMPGSGIDELTGIHARIGDPRGRSQGWHFSLELDGSRQFRLTPAGRETEGRIRSDWPDTRFIGDILPFWQQTGETGFAAEWSIPRLARSLPQVFRGTEPLAQLAGEGFGVELIQPSDPYSRARRAAKFGLLFIVLSFGAIFLMERLAPKPPHLVQYAQIGLAQCVFFLLLLSLAEQIGFGLAYLLSAAATVGLLTAYAWFAIGLGPRSGWLAMLMGLLYGVMYLVLTAGELSLLIGAGLAFLAIAATMWGTRNEDWSAPFQALRRSTSPGPNDAGS